MKCNRGKDCSLDGCRHKGKHEENPGCPLVCQREEGIEGAVCTVYEPDLSGVVSDARKRIEERQSGRVRLEIKATIECKDTDAANRIIVGMTKLGWDNSLGCSHVHCDKRRIRE